MSPSWSSWRLWVTLTGEYVYMTPQVVRQNLESRDLVSRSRSTYSRRMGTLAEAGLLEPLEKDSAYYKITPLGVDYVEGNLGASELEELV